MARIAGIVLLGIILAGLIGCRGPGTFGRRSFSGPIDNVNPGGVGYPASPIQYEQSGPIASSCGCQKY